MKTGNFSILNKILCDTEIKDKLMMGFLQKLDETKSESICKQ